MVSRVSHSALRTSRGLSLLELVLALALSVVVIGLVSMALRFQLQTFEQRRDRIEQAALGRAILRNISDDLRSAIAFRPMDLQGVSTVTGNATQSLGGVDAAASQLEPSTEPAAAKASTGNSAAGGTATQSSSDSTAKTKTGAAAGEGAYVAGLYGDQYSLQFDMTRLPRLDEFSAIVSDTGMNSITRIPTDIRTISYYLSGSTPITQVSATQARESGLSSTASSPQAMRDTTLPPEGRGLVRQERDRSLASYSEVNANFSDMSQDTGEELLAEEVTRLEFLYFDGYEWWPDWDSDDRGGLPVAIEILVGLSDTKSSEDDEPATNLAAADETSKAPIELIYRLVVRIPTAEPLDPNEVGEEEEMAEPNAAADDADAATNDNAGTTDPGTNSNTPGVSPTGGAAPNVPMGGGAPGVAQQPGGFGMNPGNAASGNGGRGNRGGGNKTGGNGDGMRSGGGSNRRGGGVRGGGS